MSISISAGHFFAFAFILFAFLVIVGLLQAIVIRELVLIFSLHLAFRHNTPQRWHALLPYSLLLQRLFPYLLLPSHSRAPAGYINHLPGQRKAAVWPLTEQRSS
jgi:hypothetical protein